MLKERIKELRKSKNWTQAELAKKINVSQQTIASWEVGRAEPNTESLITIANLFNVSVDYLLNGSGISNSPDSPKQKHVETIAAHIDDDATEEDMKEILNFIDYINKRDKK